jgi:hypothetical protein
MKANKYKLVISDDITVHIKAANIIDASDAGREIIERMTDRKNVYVDLCTSIFIPFATFKNRKNGPVIAEMVAI